MRFLGFKIQTDYLYFCLILLQWGWYSSTILSDLQSIKYIWNKYRAGTCIYIYIVSIMLHSTTEAKKVEPETLWCKERWH